MSMPAVSRRPVVPCLEADVTGSWWERTHGDTGFLVAYFSPEFGLSEALPIYSGGLGVLAGDHLKSASDLGVPLVGVGLFYRQGYFEQALEHDRQAARYPALDPERLGLALEPVGGRGRARRRAGHRAGLARERRAACASTCSSPR